MSMEETMQDILGGSVKYDKEKREQAVELVKKMAQLCGSYSPDVVLLVLESAMAETITMLSPEMGRLFEMSMEDYKERMQLLPKLVEVLDRVEPEANAQ